MNDLWSVATSKLGRPARNSLHFPDRPCDCQHLELYCGVPGFNVRDEARTALDEPLLICCLC